MSYLLLFIVALVISHYIYEALIVPTLRLKIRFELFKLRDELRFLKIKNGHNFQNKHFTYLHDSINSAISMVPRFEIYTIATINMELKKNKTLDNRIKERLKVMDDCNIPEIVEIRRRTEMLALKALCVNSGMWVPYILPILLFSLLYQFIKSRVMSIVSIPKPDLEKIIPDNTLELRKA